MPLVTPTISQNGLRLVPMEEACQAATWLRAGLSPAVSKAVADCSQWTATFPTKRVEKGNRKEAICPMVAPALADRSIHVSVVEMDCREPELEELDRLLLEGAEAFHGEIEASDPRLRCLVLMLPGVRGQCLLDATSPDRYIKGELLRRGILVGEFFPSCPFATTFNPKLFALRSPVPMYVFRTFIETDWKLVCRIPAWQKIYRERFGAPPRNQQHMGGPIWRLRQKIGWRVDGVMSRLNSPGGVGEAGLD